MTINIAPNRRRIRISNEIWAETWLGLRKRGQGKRESAAIWGGKRSGHEETVEAVYYLDDFDGGMQYRGYHYVSTEALAQFFTQLQSERRVIVGDIHTHPTRWVGLSLIDKEHPIEFRRGLHAIVLPSFALPAPSLTLAGVHVYEGDGEWHTLTEAAKHDAFVFNQQS